MIDPELPEERRDALAEEAASILGGGEVTHAATWGLRRLAYEIDHRSEADYRFWRFDAGNDVLERLDHQLKITDGVLRHRVFKVEPDAPIIVPPAEVQLGGGGERRGGRDRDRDRDRDREPAR